MIFRLFFILIFVPVIAWSQKVAAPKKSYDDKKIETTLSDEEKKSIRESYLKSKDDVELAVKLLRLDLAPYLTTLNRDILTYNYRRVSELGFDVKTNQSSDTLEAVKYAQKWAGAAKSHIKNESGMLGWGLYSARDPLSSVEYAINQLDPNDKSFGLVTVKYPKNSRMLDLRRYGALFEVSKEAYNILKKMCPSLTTSNVSFSPDHVLLEKTTFTLEKACQEIYTKTLESLGIDGLIYDYVATLSGYCDSSSYNGSAFVAFNLSLNDQNIDFFTKLDDSNLKLAEEIQAEPDPKKRDELIKKFPLGEKTFRDYEKMSVDISSSRHTTFMSKYSPKDRLEAFTPKDPELVKIYKEDLKEHNFGCSKKYEERDKPTYKPEQVWDVLLEDTVKLNLNKAINNSLDKCLEETP